jgi:hypothetical protein
VRDRLVGKDQFRLLDQGPGDRHALLFATGEAADESITERAKAKGIQTPVRIRTFGSGEPGQGAPPWMPRERASEDILEGGRVAGEMELLKDEPNA